MSFIYQLVLNPFFKRKTVTVRRANLYRQYCQHNRACVVQESKEYARDADVVKVHAITPPDKGAVVAGEDNNARVESLVVATVGDTLSGGEVVVEDVVAATEVDDKALWEHLVMATI